MPTVFLFVRAWFVLITVNMHKFMHMSQWQNLACRPKTSNIRTGTAHCRNDNVLHNRNPSSDICCFSFDVVAVAINTYA